MILRFKNWDKYNKRAKEYKNPVWFSFQNDFATDKNFFDFTDQERLIFIYLLCEASQQNKDGELILEIEHFSYHTKQKQKDILSAILKLEQKQIIDSRDRDGIVPRSHGDRDLAVTEQNRTEQDIYSSNNDEACEAVEISFSPNDLVQLWNDKADASLARVLRLTDKRRKLAQTAIRDYPDPEFWSDLISVVNSSNFLLGRGAVTGERTKAWRCDFDFIIRSDNALKIIEGKYS